MTDSPPEVDPYRVAHIVGSYVRHHQIGADQLAGLIATVHRALAGLACISQCAPMARITSGGGFHPDSCRFDLVAGKRLGGVTGRAEALRQRPPWAVEQSDGP